MGTMTTESEDNQDDHTAANSAQLKFRNYVPRDAALRQFCIPRPSVEELEKQIDREAGDAVRSAANEDVLSQIAPRRPNWDLKRDVEKKLAVLSKRTDRAIFELIRIKVSEAVRSDDFSQEHRETPADKAETGVVGHTLLAAMERLERISQEDDEHNPLAQSVLVFP
ncbi:cwf18 pre-mrna splicing factor protein [Cystoisospora suis]|uniref:Cwf18 pre-mrna splicing factor protein n=1 Tax=Cystoisospora suis TaxID=483139 RepID=A0A2C6L757_9APIC|nr:cwf18 pre-mrna splicing factor protein [Cystoisospora suis]